MPFVGAGSALTGQTLSGTQDDAFVQAGGTIEDCTVEALATAAVNSGGTALDDTISSGGFQYDRGFDQGSTVVDGGIILAFGSLDTDVVSSGGEIQGETGAQILLLQVFSAGFVELSAGTVLTSATIGNGGAVVALPGASLVSATIVQGGSAISAGAAVFSGTTLVSASQVLSGMPGIDGQLFVLGGGTATASTMEGGQATVISGLLSDNTVVGGMVSLRTSALGTDNDFSTAGAEEGVYSGGTSTAETFDGAQQVVYAGTALNDILISGGLQQVTSGDLVEGTTIGNGGILLTDGPESAADINLLPGGTLDLASIPYDGTVTSDFDPTSDILVISHGGSTYDFQLAGDYTSEEFALSPRGGGTSSTQTDVTVEAVACFCHGTRIATPLGPVAVEQLAIGDRVSTVSGTRVIRWIGRRSYDGRFIAANRDVLPIVFRAASLADGIPARDLRVSPRHAMFLDGVLIPAELLVNGRSIVQVEQVGTLTYYHIELDTHDILLAEGAPSESFIDHDSRLMFQNAAEHLLLHPAMTTIEECAPRVDHGEVLERVRQRIALRAGLAADHAHDAAIDGPLDGRIDILDAHEVSGWAFDATRPHTPVRLEVVDGDRVMATLVANRFRPDLKQARLGDGRCAYAFRFEVPPADLHAIRVRRVRDAAVLVGRGAAEAVAA